MEDMKNQDIPEKGFIDDKKLEKTDYQQKSLSELKDINKLLEAENEAYKTKIKKLSQEIDEIDNSILSAKGYIESTEKRIKEYPDKIEKLKLRTESLLAELNNIMLKVKSCKEDENSTLLLRNTLMEEYEKLKNEKAVLFKRINKMERAIEKISSERDLKLPKLKKYDEMLKEAWNVFHETENRMDVSLKLQQRRTDSKSEHT